MNAIKTLAACAAIAGSLAAAGPAAADNPTFYIFNNTPMPLWASINTQAFGRGTVVRTCIAPGQTWAGRPVNTMQHTNVYIRSEFKKQASGCDQGANLFDSGATGTILTINNNGRSQMTYYSPNRKTKPTANNSGWH